MTEPATVHGDLTADEVATVTVDNHDGQVEILIRAGSGAVWVTFDGVDPVAEADGTYVVVGARRFTNLPVRDAGPLTIKLLTEDTGISYSVEGAL